MKLIVGLGNPGIDYQKTRHSAGHIIVDALKKSPKYKAVKSDSFMNESGTFVKSLCTKYNIQNTDLYIVHDDLDIKLGEWKIQFGRGPKDHNGILDIEDKLGTKDFWRVRIGVDNRPLDNKPLGIEYVLQNFSDEEMVVLDRVNKEVCKKLETL